MIPVVIERAKWRCGGDGAELRNRFGRTELLNDKGMMCCLGFASIAAGIPLRDIEGVGEPSELETDVAGLTFKDEDYPYDFWNNTQAAKEAMEVNDDRSLSTIEREAQVSFILKQAGYDVTFTGEYPPAPNNAGAELSPRGGKRQEPKATSTKNDKTPTSEVL